MRVAKRLNIKCFLHHMEQLKVINKLWDLLPLIVVQLCVLEEDLDVKNSYLHIMTIMIEPVI